MGIRQQETGEIKHERMPSWIKNPGMHYAIPFIVFMGLTEAARYFPSEAHFLYVFKTILVGFLLWFWRDTYAADVSLKMTLGGYMVAVAAGLLVLVIWVLPENYLPQQGVDNVFDPYSFNFSPAAVYALIAVRLAGAALVVPVMEELFWRSFLLRYLVNPDFNKVALGTFTWFSFTAVVVLFGVEHHRLIQGMIAGVIYTALLIYQKNLRGCIIAHGVTNLGLGVFVIVTQRWEFW